MLKKKKVCPFFLLENSRPLFPWGPLDSLSTCLGNDSLMTTGSKLNVFVFFSFNLYNWVICSCLSMNLVGPGKTNSKKNAYMSPFNTGWCEIGKLQNRKIYRSHFSQFMLIIFFSVNTFYKRASSYFILQDPWICTFIGFLKIYSILYPESFIS